MAPSSRIYRQVFAPVARTATLNSPTYVDLDHPRLGGHFIFDTTAIGAAPSVVPTIQGFDPFSGKFYNILAGVAITAVGTTRLTVYPGVAATANVAAADFLPPQWRILMTHGNSDSITYSVSAILRD